MGPGPVDRARRGGEGGVLGAGVRWHGGRHQEHRQDPGREYRPACAGLLRVRLEEGRRRDGLAPPLWSQADSGALADRAGGVRGLPPVRVPRPLRRARDCRTWRHPAAQRAVSRQPGVGPLEPRGAGTDPRARPAAPRDRRGGGGPRGGAGRADQHDHADLLLPVEWPAPGRGGQRPDQGGDHRHLWQARPRRGATQPCRRGPGAGGAARRSGAGDGHRDSAPAAAGTRRGPGLRAAGDGGDAGRSGRSTSRECVPARRHLAHRDLTMGKAQPGGGDPAVGPRHLHPVQLVCAGLSPRRHPGQGVRPGGAGDAAGGLPACAMEGPRSQGCRLHGAGGARGLHRLPSAVSRSAPPRTRATRDTRRSTWCRSGRSASASAPTTSSS